MTIQTAPDPLVIAVPAGKELDAALDRAMDLLTPVAMAERVGVLVTRLAPGRYQAQLYAELPPDTTEGSWGTSLLFLWINVWSHGGGACLGELVAFFQGSQKLSENDAVVLGLVVDEFHNPDEAAQFMYPLPTRSGSSSVHSCLHTYTPITDLSSFWGLDGFGCAPGQRVLVMRGSILSAMRCTKEMQHHGAR